MNTIGIDVGCKELVVVIMVNGKARKAKSFDNTPSGHQTILPHFKFVAMFFIIISYLYLLILMV